PLLVSVPFRITRRQLPGPTLFPYATLFRSRMVLLHLDGSIDVLPETGDPVVLDGRTVGRVGTVIQHHELGPIALALVKRSVPTEDRKSTRLNSSHVKISYAVLCLKKKKNQY